MQKLFDEVGSLDRRCYEEFALSEDILMEHAANGMAEYIKKHFPLHSKIIIACGSGNNGADGIALGRLLHKDFNVKILALKEAKSEMALLQTQRSLKIGVPFIERLEPCDIFVDALVGTGFRGELDAKLQKDMKEFHALEAFKIACDIPSGLSQSGLCAKETFRADVSLTMGALKKSMFLDEAKTFVGKIEVLNLGLAREIYETQTQWNLLDLKDLQLPYREDANTHKGSYGHLAIACGEKEGAAILSALSALKFGAGLVTLVGFKEKQIPHEIMASHQLPNNTTALALGMGLGEEFSDKELSKFLDNSLPLIADADIFHMSIIKDILQRESIVLTPHPKEFIALLQRVKIADITIEELQQKRFHYVEAFCKAFPKATLLLKGANVIIAQGEDFFINPHGNASLAKGGSGDVLSGLIGALLAQKFTPLQAAINASLTHTTLALNYKGANFSLTPYRLIEEIEKL